jgi:hypothetical protein
MTNKEVIGFFGLFADFAVGPVLRVAQASKGI